MPEAPHHSAYLVAGSALWGRWRFISARDELASNRSKWFASSNDDPK